MSGDLPAADLQGGWPDPPPVLVGRGDPAPSLGHLCPAGYHAPREWREVAPEQGTWCQALSLPGPPVLGPVAHACWARVVSAWRSVSSPTACALARRC